jgi:hypothetical protein
MQVHVAHEAYIMILRHHMYRTKMNLRSADYFPAIYYFNTYWAAMDELYKQGCGKQRWCMFQRIMSLQIL